MHNEKIHLTRIHRLLERQKKLLIGDKNPLNVEYSATGEDYQLMQIGETWGKPWDTGWFRVTGRIPEDFAGKEYQLLFDCDGEACLMLDGIPHQGFTPKVDWYHKAAKNLLPLASLYLAGEEVALLIDASANDLFGAQKEEYRLRECSLVTFNEALYQKLMDIGLLLDLAEALPAGTVRRQRIIHGLNKVCDFWNSDSSKVEAILKELLEKPAHASALTSYSVGQAHLDLAWLWPLYESRRKGARTFANALRLLERYPDYIFGASQAQLYQWIKEDHPALYEETKKQIRVGRWEVQGAAWVEFDTNLISGESIIRQFLYGKEFLNREFGFAPRVLWLPDCFGFSGNLPQYLRGCGVDHFITQKLSWNETNTFPHHLFVWEGIDGSRVLAHHLPTNNYNFSNDPSSFLETEKRYAQNDVCEAFLNLYGIGDGGGGPTRDHIEYGLRQKDLEGVPKFRFSPSSEFFDHISKLDYSELPVAYGELYLEFHRGTYTTQASMKQNNRISERKLGEAEFLAVLCGMKSQPEHLREIWRDVLLLQFHDILPGSSIGKVYFDADVISVTGHDRIDQFTEETLMPKLGLEVKSNSENWLVFNPSNQELEEWIEMTDEPGIPFDEEGNQLPHLMEKDGLKARVKVPAWGCKSIQIKALENEPKNAKKPVRLELENQWLKVKLSENGSFTSIWDKVKQREILASESNLLQLWEDEPNDWGAWDINHFYRDTQPRKVQSAVPVPDQCFSLPGQFDRVTLELKIGNSELWQSIELYAHEPFIRVTHLVNWQEKHKMLRVHFYPDLHSGTATYGIQGGVIQRSSKPANAWEEARFEVPAQRFADLSQPERGCALICDEKYGWRIRDNEMELNLLRSPADVDPEADIHGHMYSYAFYPHAGDYAHSDVFQTAEKFANQLMAYPVDKLPEKLPKAGFSLESSHVNLDNVKPAENIEGTVLRLHEFQGRQGIAVLNFNKPPARIFECDMLENPLQKLKPTSTLELHFQPFETKTLLILEES